MTTAKDKTQFQLIEKALHDEGFTETAEGNLAATRSFLGSAFSYQALFCARGQSVLVQVMELGNGNEKISIRRRPTGGDFASRLA